MVVGTVHLCLQSLYWPPLKHPMALGLLPLCPLISVHGPRHLFWGMHRAQLFFPQWCSYSCQLTPPWLSPLVSQDKALSSSKILSKGCLLTVSAVRSLPCLSYAQASTLSFTHFQDLWKASEATASKISCILFSLRPWPKAWILRLHTKWLDGMV